MREKIMKGKIEYSDHDQDNILDFLNLLNQFSIIGIIF